MKKILLYLFFCVLVMTTTGGVTVLMGQSGIKMSNQPSDELPKEEIPLTKEQLAMNAVMNGAMSIITTGNISATGNVTLVNGSTTTQIDLDIQAKLNMSDLLQSKLKLKASMDGLALDLKYIDSVIYLSVLDKNIKMKVSSLMDVASILTTYMGVDIGSALPAIDPSNLDSLLTNIQMEENENGTKIVTFDLQVGMAIPVAITLNEKGAFQSIDITDVEALGSKISLHLAMNSSIPKFVVDADNYISYDYLPVLAESVLNTLNQTHFDITAKLNVGGFPITLEQLLFDKEGMALQAKINVLGIRASATYYENTTYFDFYAKKFKIGNSTIEEMLQILLSQINIDAAIDNISMDTVIGLLNQVEDISFSFEDEKVCFNISAFGMKIKIVLSNDKYIEKITLDSSIVSGEIVFRNIGKTFTFSQPQDSYYDLSFLPQLLKAGLNTLDSNSFNISGTVVLGGEAITLNHMYLNIKDLSAKASISLLGLNAGFSYIDNSAYIDLGGKKFKLEGKTMQELIGIVAGLAGGDSSFDLDAILKEFTENLSDISYKYIDNELHLGISLYDVKLSLIISEDLYIKAIKGSYKGVVIDLVFNEYAENFGITKPEGYHIDLDFLSPLLSASLNTLANDYFTLKGNINAGGTQIDLPKLLFDKKTLAFSADINALGINLSITHKNGTTYLDVLSKKFKLQNKTVAELLPLIMDMLAGGVNIDIPAILAQIEDIKLNGNQIDIYAFGDVFSIVIENSMIQSITASMFSIEFMSVTDKFIIETPTEYYIDLGFVPMLMTGFENLITSKKFHLEASAKITGGANVKDYIQFDINNLMLDITNFNDILFTGGVQTSGDLSIGGGIAFGNNTIFVNFQGLKMQIRMDTIMELIGVFAGSLPNMSFDVGMIETVLSFLQDIYYDENSLSIVIKLNETNTFTVKLQMDVNGQLSSISGRNIVSTIDGSIVDFDIKLLDYGQNVIVKPPYDEYYMDFNALPTIVNALVNTAGLKAFDIGSDFIINSNNQKHITSSPRIIVNCANGIEVGAQAKVDFADSKAVDYNLGLWYDSYGVHAQINNMKVKIAGSSILDIVDSVMSLLGSELNIVDIVGMVSSFDFMRITEMVKDIVTERHDQGTTIRIVLDGTILYGLANIETGDRNKDVIIEITINSDNYFTSVRVANVIAAPDQNLDFALYLNNIGKVVGTSSDDIKMPQKGDTKSYIDLSGLAPVLQAVKKTADKDYFHITGKLNYPGIAEVAEVFPQDVLLRVNKDVNGKVRLSLTVASEGYRAWTAATRVRQVSTVFYEDGMLYFRRHNLWRTTATIFDPDYTNQSLHYEKATLEQFGANPMYYVNLMLQISLIESFAGSFGGNAIDFTNILTNMTIRDHADKKEVTAGINVQELAGTTALSGFNLNFFVSNAGYLTDLTITNLSIIGILNLNASLKLHLDREVGDCFEGDTRPDKFVLGIINKQKVYYEGFNKSIWG